MKLDKFKKPLNKAEIDLLDEFWELDQVFVWSDEGILERPVNGLAEIDGFTAALACGPKKLTYSQWAKWIWDTEHGRQRPRDWDYEERIQIESLLRRHKFSVENAISLDCYRPQLFEEFWTCPGQFSGTDYWCMGFVRAMRFNKPYWNQIGHHAPDSLGFILELAEMAPNEQAIYLGDLEFTIYLDDYYDCADTLTKKVQEIFKARQVDTCQLELEGFRNRFSCTNSKALIQ